MNKYGMRIVACALAGTLALSGYQLTIEARIKNSSVPVAGIAVALDEGSTIQDLQTEVVENIAYLESISGVRPNIVEASERAAISELGVWSAAQSVPGTLMTAPNVLQPFLEAADVPTEEPEAEANEPSSEEAASTPQTEATESGADDEEDLKLSAGFSATEVYDDVDEAVTGEETEAVSEEETEDAAEEGTEEETETETEEASSEEEQDFSGLVIAQVNNYVNVRSIPSEEGEIVGKLYDKSVGELVEEEDGWYKITSGNCTGYVKGEYCAVGEEAENLAKEVGTTYAIVNTTTLKVRQEASTEASVLGLVPIEEELVVLEELDGWVKIAIEEGDGYVSRDFVNLRTDFVHAESREEEEARLAKEAKARQEARAAASAAASRTVATPQEKSANTQAVIAAAQSTAASSEGSEMGKAVINYATQFVGNSYVYGGSSLTNGTDCSGFVMSVYANFGVSLPHSSSALRTQGYDVGGLENAQPGDIVCYSGHVGLYVGNGQIVHASNSKTGIIVSNASYRKVLAVRRIF